MKLMLIEKMMVMRMKPTLIEEICELSKNEGSENEVDTERENDCYENDAGAQRKRVWVTRRMNSWIYIL